LKGEKGRAVRPAPCRLPGFRLALRALLGVVTTSCAGSLAATLRAPARSTAVPETFECAQQELRALGYSPGAFDRDAGRLVAQKPDPQARRAHYTTLRRVLDRIEVEAGATELIVKARTIVEYESRRGPTEEEESASATAKADARALIERCGQPAGR
jgi:hypothetical protein